MGMKTDLWNKIMKEVKLQHTAGPYTRETFPFFFYWQNLVGLIPKKGNPKETQMIVNMSYKDGFSVNHFTCKEECTVKYHDIDAAIQMITKIQEQTTEGHVYLAKCDGRAAFKQLPVAKADFPLLVMKAEHPVTGEMHYFINKVVVFGSSRSCRIYSEFAESLAHITEYLDPLHQRPNEYLGDLLTGGASCENCDSSLQTYLDLCEEINFPISEENTVWSTQIIVFLGLLLNTITRTISIPIEKQNSALTQIDVMMRVKKTTVHKLHVLAGLLNFLSRAIVPGQTFIRRLYDKMEGLKQHYHIRVDHELRQDLLLWKKFLVQDASLCRPFMDFSKTLTVDELDF